MRDQTPEGCSDQEEFVNGPQGWGCYPRGTTGAGATPTGTGGGGGGGGGVPGGGTAGAARPAGPSGVEDELTKAITELARMLAQQGAGLYNVGFPAYSQAVSYYSALLGRGGRAGATQAVAPAAEGVAANYAGAKQAVLSGYLRGGARDQALAELERSQAADTAHLTAGVQPAAAEHLLAGGLGGAQAGMQGTGESANIYGGVLTTTQQERQYQSTLAENKRQFDASLALQRDALAKMGGGGGGQALAQAALDEQKRQFDASLALQQQQMRSAHSAALGQTIGTIAGGLIGAAATKNPAGAAAGAGVGGAVGGGVSSKSSAPRTTVPTSGYYSH